MSATRTSITPESIVILHISDMQFGKFHRFTGNTGNLPNPYEALIARLTDDLDRLATQERLRPDLIICTGDLAEWGMAKEFTDAFDFLDKLCRHFSLPHSRCIVIPGNHDINRSNCEGYFNECRGDGKTPTPPWFPKWKHYKAAFDGFYAGFPGITFDEGAPWSLFVDAELGVVIAGLNSTMDDGHDGAVSAEDRADKGHHGLCTESQLKEFKKRLSEPQFHGWLRIGAVHHNINRGCREDNENLRDADLLGGILADHLHLLLHGHTHEAKSDILATKLRVYSTGSASLKTGGEKPSVPTDVPNQYQFLAINRRSITRYCRQYNPRSTPPEFIADVRQSKSKCDWILIDDVDFADVGRFVAAAETKSHGIQVKEAKPPLVGVIPGAPAFYAEPDYIGSHSFVGRESQLQELSDWAKPADPTNLLLFEAIGGNGKSMLTWEWVNNHAADIRTGGDAWAGRFWYSFYEKGAVMADFCQRALAYMTGKPLAEFAKKKTAELAKDLLAQLHARPWLLILDGLERVLVAYHRIDAAEVPDEEANTPTDKIVNRNPCDAIRDEDNDLLRSLAAAKPSKILVSSRLTPRILLNPSGQPIIGARRITLPGLRPTDAEKLIRSCGVKGDSAAIQNYLTANCDNHPLVIGVLAGLINNYLPNRGNFDVWVADPDGGARLDLSSLDLVQRRNHILRVALDALSPASRQLLSTLALLSESVDYDTLKAFNPHLPPEPEEVDKPEPPEKYWRWMALSEDEKSERHRQYKEAVALRKSYEELALTRLTSTEYREAPKKLIYTVRDLEHRGLLQYDGRTQRHDLHPVVRGVAAGGMQAAEKESCGLRVVDHFASLSHNPYEEAETLEDLRPGLNIVRTLLKIGHFQQAADAYRGDLARALLFNLEAFAEALSLLRPFFPVGWGNLPMDIKASDAGYLGNDAAIALDECDEGKDALAAGSATLQSRLKQQDWVNFPVTISNMSMCSLSQNLLAQTFRIAQLALDFAISIADEEAIFRLRLDLFYEQARFGEWEKAECTWQLLEPMGRQWSRARYRPGDAEYYYAKFKYWRGSLKDVNLITAERLAMEGKNRGAIRSLHWLRGAWWFDQGEWALAAQSFSEAVRMARERGIPDEQSETGLALVKHHLGELDKPDQEAERLSQLRHPAHRLLAELWLVRGNTKQAKTHALAAYKWAWADGEPYVNRYELTKTTELLKRMEVPIPNFRPYDPTKEDKLSWEDDVRVAIERIRAEKTAEQ